ncbi:GTP-binding protein [Methylomarinum sp. Ch1-1]|uniref:GTP-binding protein n=1 Tax=Methylomarinum roseum TaxID=3067653 RepID=A0AAU7NRU9_9GAMM
MNKIIDTAIAANLITGFLGVGKTTAIQALLDSKPADQTWAVLVNEFGEIGIDGSRLHGDNGENQGIFIRELPGGCLCCTAGVPFQVALNQLIKASRPDRLLIEPTGLGHPREVIAMLTSPPYTEVIDLKATLTLVDARKVIDPRYAEHDIFRQQLRVADRIIANKRDLYRDDDERRLLDYLQDLNLGHLPVETVIQGQLRYDWLLLPRHADNIDEPVHQHAPSLLDQPLSLAENDYRRIDNHGGGFYSSGWLFGRQVVFDYVTLHALLSVIDAERVKAIMRTDRGCYVFNSVDGVLTQSMLEHAEDSRIEVISRNREDWEDLQAGLLNARLNDQ